MNPIRLVLAAACLVASAPALADNCLPPPTMPELQVAAPEMAPAPAPAVLCVTAAEIVARARASLPQTASPSAPVPATATTTTAGSAQPTNWANSPASRSAVNGYVPKTEHDNTPWRFDMSQNGKRMTAEEFDAWMKAKGIHVATGKPAAVTATAAAEAATEAAASTATGAGEKAEAE